MKQWQGYFQDMQIDSLWKISWRWCLDHSSISIFSSHSQRELIINWFVTICDSVRKACHDQICHRFKSLNGNYVRITHEACNMRKKFHYAWLQTGACLHLTHKMDIEHVYNGIKSTLENYWAFPSFRETTSSECEAAKIVYGTLCTVRSISHDQSMYARGKIFNLWNWSNMPAISQVKLVSFQQPHFLGRKFPADQATGLHSIVSQWSSINIAPGYR
jgi:hypothetical protein